jgi:hypothetical protein
VRALFDRLSAVASPRLLAFELPMMSAKVVWAARSGLAADTAARGWNCGVARKAVSRHVVKDSVGWAKARLRAVPTRQIHSIVSHVSLSTREPCRRHLFLHGDA